MTISVESVNISPVRTVATAQGQIRSGIAKVPADEPVLLTELGFQGDGQADKRHHGGPDKAAYAYPMEHLDAFWSAHLAQPANEHAPPLGPGAFGENLSIRGIDERDACIGDLFRIGKALVQISEPRLPCRTLACRMGTDTVITLMLESRRTGFYLRVCEPGPVAAGDAMHLVETDPARLSIHEIVSLHADPDADRARLERAASMALLPGSWRTRFANRAERLG